MDIITFEGGAMNIYIYWLRRVIFTLFVLCLSCSNSGLETHMSSTTEDLSQYSSDEPQKAIYLLFIHHSTGGELLADKGEQSGLLAQYRIYATHPNGGGLRRLLMENNYIVHEASYGSVVGEETDICHWNRKFRDHMGAILITKQQDEKFTDGTRNRVVVFKSCFPNSWMTSDGKAPGDPDSCEKTTANYKAVYRNLLDYFRNQPDTLFVVFTAPPLVKPELYTKEKIFNTLKTIIGRPDTVEKIGVRARSFNNWLKDVKNGWLKDYDQNNVVVFDYYDILTDKGKSDWSAYPTRGGRDSHSSNESQVRTSQEFVPVLNVAVDRMGL